MAKPWQSAFQRWLDKRIPKQRQLELNQRRIFIFPSRQGGFFLLVILLLLLAAINYQNNLIYLLCFALLSLMNTAILFTYFNVSGMKLALIKAHPGFAGDNIAFDIRVSRKHQRFYHQLMLSWPGQAVSSFDLLQDDSTMVTVYAKSNKRGVFKPGRLLLETYYPLGLIRCWSWIDLDFSAVVYPQPLAFEFEDVQGLAGDEGTEKPRLDADDFYGFREYQSGDSLRHVDWRSLAKGLPLQSKIYAAKQQQEQWVDWYALQGVSTEQRLSHCCFWALELEKQQLSWGLRLPGTELSVNSGPRHLQNALQALALFEVTNDSSL